MKEQSAKKLVQGGGEAAAYVFGVNAKEEFTIFIIIRRRVTLSNAVIGWLSQGLSVIIR